MVVTGGEPPYNYLWYYEEFPTPVSADENLTGAQPGLYSLIVTDSYGCAITDNFNIEEPEPLTINTSSISVVNASCFGLCDGSISINAEEVIIGGSEPYSCLL